MKKELTCINCPMGCILEVEIRDGEILSIRGNSCPRGERYARQECLNPTRTVTSSVLLKNGAVPISVRTSQPVPKASMEDCLREIRQLRPDLPVHIGQVLLKNIAGTGADLLATRDCP